MAIVKTALNYLTLIQDYHLAPVCKQPLLLKGPMALACQSFEPHFLRVRLRDLWEKEANRHGVEINKWKSWG